MNNHLLSSYPRSGNHLIRFIIEYVTGFPTKGCSSKDLPVCTNTYEDSSVLNHVVQNAQCIIEKTHIPRSCSSLIAITRDYRECIVKYLKYNITKANEASILCEIQKYMRIQEWHLTTLSPVFRIQYERIISSDETRSRDVYNLLLFIIAHSTIIDICLHTTIIERLETLIQNKEELFRQCAGARNRHWGGYNSASRSKYHILRLPYTSRCYFERLCMQSVKTLSHDSDGVLQYLQNLQYSPGYVDYAILPKGGICNRIRIILRHIYHFRKQNQLSKDSVNTRVYVLWKSTDHCRQSFDELFDENCLDEYNCTIVPYEDSVHGTVCIDPMVEKVCGQALKYTDLYRALTPKASLRNAIQETLPGNTPFIAIHVRRTDHTELAQSKGRFTTDEEFHTFIAKCPPQCLIYVATDNCETQKQYVEKYGKRIFWYEEIPLSVARRHHSDETGAIVDLYVCSSASYFKGSGYSSFTDTIEILRNNRISCETNELVHQDILNPLHLM